MRSRRIADALGPIQLARAARTSIKALRYYERRGLIRPKRSANGWRIYGPDDIERLMQIQSFKRMGFELAEIATLLNASPDELMTSLCAQEARLLQQREAVDAALKIVRRARRERHGGDSLIPPASAANADVVDGATTTRCAA